MVKLKAGTGRFMVIIACIIVLVIEVAAVKLSALKGKLKCLFNLLADCSEFTDTNMHVKHKA